MPNSSFTNSPISEGLSKFVKSSNHSDWLTTTILTAFQPISVEFLQELNDTPANVSDSDEDQPISVRWLSKGIVLTIFIALTVLIVTVFTVLGNILVAAAVFTVRKLHQPSNYLLVSLAAADFCVGLFVMPLSGLYHIRGRWVFGRELCAFWISADFLLCTASILSLCAISVDRYWAISRPLKYVPSRTTKKILLYIFIAWTLGLPLCIVPLFVYPVSDSAIANGVCQLTQSIPFQVTATLISFYIPILIMLAVNWRIFAAARRLSLSDSRSTLNHTPSNARSRTNTNTSANNNNNNNINCNYSRSASYHNSSFNISLPSQQVGQSINHLHLHDQHHPHHRRISTLSTKKGSICSSMNGAFVCESTSVSGKRGVVTHILAVLNNVWPDVSRVRGHSHLMRETRAAKTLSVIMGAFIICWLPFFVIALVRPICADGCFIPKWLDILVTWLGYLNSTINPPLYAVFNRDFRIPFREIVCCRCGTMKSVMRSETFQQIYGFDHETRRNSRLNSLNIAASAHSSGGNCPPNAHTPLTSPTDTTHIISPISPTGNYFEPLNGSPSSIKRPSIVVDSWAKKKPSIVIEGVRPNPMPASSASKRKMGPNENNKAFNPSTPFHKLSLKELYMADPPGTAV